LLSTEYPHVEMLVLSFFLSPNNTLILHIFSKLYFYLSHFSMLPTSNDDAYANGKMLIINWKGEEASLKNFSTEMKRLVVILILKNILNCLRTNFH